MLIVGLYTQLYNGVCRNVILKVKEVQSAVWLGARGGGICSTSSCTFQSALRGVSWADFGDELVRFRSQFMSFGDFLCLAGRAGWRVAPNPLSSRKARPLRQSRIGGIAWRTGCLLS